MLLLNWKEKKTHEVVSGNPVSGQEKMPLWISVVKVTKDIRKYET